MVTIRNNQTLIADLAFSELPRGSGLHNLRDKLRALPKAVAEFTSINQRVYILLTGQVAPEDLAFAVTALGDHLGRSEWRGRPAPA